jgi:hypothetical protein
MSADENADGRMDLDVLFEDGVKKSLRRDADGDGFFEIVQTYSSDGLGVTIERLAKDSATPRARLYYVSGLLKEKRHYDSHGRLESLELFNENGELTQSKESESGRLSLTWFYEGGEPVRAERDKNLDGVPEEIFTYTNGSLVAVEEDANGDGKPDVWEQYGPDGCLESRSEDLDFDGIPDMEKKRSKQLSQR